MWYIHDYLEYELASGQVAKGYKGCPQCGPSIITRRSAALGKNVYLRHCKYLYRHHLYQNLKRVFDRKEEMRPPPFLMSR
jgi:hypothetical protein